MPACLVVGGERSADREPAELPARGLRQRRTRHERHGRDRATRLTGDRRPDAAARGLELGRRHALARLDDDGETAVGRGDCRDATPAYRLVLHRGLDVVGIDVAAGHDDRLVAATDHEQLAVVHHADVTGNEVAVIGEAELGTDVAGELRRAAELDRSDRPFRAAFRVTRTSTPATGGPVETSGRDASPDAA